MVNRKEVQASQRISERVRKGDGQKKRWSWKRGGKKERMTGLEQMK